ncbi:hypothetical protein [Streptomyces sp. NL15-2K]|nr:MULTISPECIES: hypothetical protein [Actinomycetes]WKX15882.1 hypothetical protein Q4V64_53705 [Kutzneria buriramensis]GCB42731.1 hypothetical protein SNL152K_13 [Streptomyces sp. NL15-2K]
MRAFDRRSTPATQVASPSEQPLLIHWGAVPPITGTAPDTGVLTPS